MEDPVNKMHDTSHLVHQFFEKMKYSTQFLLNGMLFGFIHEDLLHHYQLILFLFDLLKNTTSPKS